MLLFALGAAAQGLSQTVLYFENMYNGTGGANADPIATHESNNRFNEDGLTYSGTGTLRNNTTSDYLGASGTWNVLLNTGNQNFLMDGLNLSGYSGITLKFGVHKSTSAGNGSTFIVEYSTTGTGGTFTALAFIALPTNASGWFQRTVTTAIPNTATTIRFINTDASIQYRIDDIEISGTLAGCTAPSTQASDIVFSNVNSASLSLNWTNGNGAGRVILMNTSNTFTAPTAGSNPSANTTYAGSGQQVVFNGTGSGPITINGLAPGNTYHFRVYEYCAPERVYQTATATNNPRSIAIVKDEPSNFPNSFACGITTSASIPLSWQDATGSVTPDGYLIKWSATSFAAIAAPVDGVAETNGAGVQNVAQGVQNFTASGLASSTNYFFKIWSYTNSGANINYKLVGEPQTSCSTLSNASDIVEVAGFDYTSNILYTNFQGSAPLTTTANNVGVFQFQVRDGGGSADADNLGTTLNSITFNLGTTHINYIQAAALFNGTTLLNNAPTINTGAGTITFSGLSGAAFTAPDNGTLTITLHVSFNNNVVDNQQLQFTITAASASAAGSTFAAANAGGAASSITGDRNRIEVVADRIAFTTQPQDQTVNANLATFTISARDINSRVDLDANLSIALTTSGTGMTATSPYSLTNGELNISNVQFNAIQGPITLTATTTGLTINSVVSNNFNITNIATGSYRSTSDCLWSSTGGNNTGTWQVFSGGWQNLPFGTYTNAYPPTNSTTAVIYIRHNVTLQGTNTTKNIVIENGGYLNTSTVTPTFKNVLVKDGGTFDKNPSNGLKFDADGILEVENGGTFIYRHTNTTSRSTNLWAGTEKFHPNSNFVVKQTDTGTGNLVIENVNDVSPFNGALFGNFIVDMSAGTVPLFVSGMNGKITNGDFILRTGSDNGMIFNSGNYYVTIGGNLIVESTYTQPFTLTNSNSTVTMTVNGNVTHNGTAEFRLANSQATNNPSVTLNIDGNLTLGSSNMSFDIGTSSTGTNKSTLNLKGSLTTGSGNILTTNTQAAKRGAFNFVGTTEQNIDVASTGATIENARVNFNVKNGASVKLVNRDLELGTNSKFTVENGGILNFGFNENTALNMTIPASMTGAAFESQQGSTLRITSPNGITTTAGVGNVRVVPANRTYNQTATFHYIGKANQETGNAITNTETAKVVICELENNNLILSLSNSFGISNATTINATGGLLDIRKGQVIETENEFITASSGTLYMKPGTLYRVAKGNAGAAAANADLIPRLEGSTFFYNLQGGTIELSGSGAANAFQTLRGSEGRPNYRNVKFSGANTLGVDYKNLSTNTQLDSALILTGNTVVDCINGAGVATTFEGNGAVVMDGGRLRIKRLNALSPSLVANNLPYNITGGTVEFYGSSATENQRIRHNINYHNIEINAVATNLDFIGQLGNVSAELPFSITGNLNVNAPASLALKYGNYITGSGNFNVLDGSTLFYSDENGIKTSGTTFMDGQVRTTGAKLLSANASYGFMDNIWMVSGNALPSEVVNLYVRKAPHSRATLTNSLEVKNQLVLHTGVVATGSNELYVSNSAVSSILGGEMTGMDKFVEGRLIRNTADGNSYNFPIGIFGYDAQGFTIDVQGGGQVLGYLEPTNTAPAYGQAYCDIETTTGPGSQIGDGTPGGDGNLDLMTFDLVSPLQWNVTNPNGGVSLYDITIHPNGPNAINPVIAADGTPIRFTTRNGYPGNPGEVELGNVAGEFEDMGFLACPNGFTLTGQTGFSTFLNLGSTYGNTSLPIELVSFEATAQEKEVALTWVTASELNNDYFTVERSADGSSWEVVLTKQGAGTTTQRTEYNALDSRPLAGLSYYRLKQTDFDGKFSYSSIQSVFMNSADKQLVKAVNVLGQTVDQNAKGLVILMFSNGESQKIVNE